MKKIIFLSLLGFAITFTGCSKDDDDNTGNGNGSYQVNYKNQNLKGKISGESWTYAQGNAHTSDGFNLDFTHWFDIIDTAQIDTCFANSSERSKVIFSIDDEIRTLSVGKYKLNIDLNTFEGRTVTFVDWTETTVLNTIASKGEYEILTVDTVNRIVTGRMDAFYDNENFVNGNFTLKYCYW